MRPAKERAPRHQIVVDPDLAHELGQAVGQTVFCDSAGRVIGFFSPLKDSPRLEDLQFEPPRSLAETESLRQVNRTGKPLDEILGRLGY